MTGGRAFITALLLVTLGAAPALQLHAVADPSADLDRGASLIAENKLSEAAQVFLDVAVADPGLASRAYREAARCYLGMKKLDDALDCCNRGMAKAQSPEDRAALGALLKDLRLAVARSYMDAKAWEDAVSELNALAADYPEESNLADARRRFEQLQAAHPDANLARAALRRLTKLQGEGR